MCIIKFKTGHEHYCSRLYTAEFFLLQPGDIQGDKLTSHHTYLPHEEILCGYNSCFGRWEIGHVNLDRKTRIQAIFTRKIIIWSINYKNPQLHEIQTHNFTMSCRGNVRNTRVMHWGYNGGNIYNEFLVGSYQSDRIKKRTFDVIKGPLENLPF